MRNIFDGGQQRRGRFGGIIFFLALILGAGFFFFKPASSVASISYSEFLAELESGNVAAVNISDGRAIYGRFLKDGGEFKTLIPFADSDLMPLLKSKRVSVEGSFPSDSFVAKIISSLPWLLIALLFITSYFRNASMERRDLQFGQSGARLYDKDEKKITFADVAGHDEPKRELSEIVEFLKNPEKYRNIGAKIPRGILLLGEPGTGKTLLARAVAGEAGVDFLHISGSDFVEMFVGVGASRIRDLFDQGRELSPCIIFIDEIDAVGRARGTGFGGGHDEREQALNQLLVEMDGFSPSENVIVLAATNRPDVLDPALLRAGRFDRQVTVPLPDLAEREAILTLHAKNVKTDESVDLQRLARETPGMSGADIANMVNEGAIFAVRAEKGRAGMAEMELARDKFLMGDERKSLVMTEKEREMTAYHEAGHAILHYFLKNAEPLHKVTIIPHGRALGVTVGLPEHDRYSRTKSELLDEVKIMLGGYVAESLVYSDTTTGTANDLQQATAIVRKMVCEWGMDERTGVVSYCNDDEPVFVGRELTRHKAFSEYSAKSIDEAVRQILEDAKLEVFGLLEKKRGELDAIASELLSRETLCDSEVRQIIGLPASEST